MDRQCSGSRRRLSASNPWITIPLPNERSRLGKDRRHQESQNMQASFDKCSGEVATLAPTKREAEIVSDFKKEVTDRLLEVCAVMDRANKAGLVVNFQLGVIPPGKNIISQLSLAKHY